MTRRTLFEMLVAPVIARFLPKTALPKTAPSLRRNVLALPVAWESAVRERFNSAVEAEMKQRALVLRDRAYLEGEQWNRFVNHQPMSFRVRTGK